ncbi:MAG: AraC family transcriptional regulator, partial [Pedobacter sp.]
FLERCIAITENHLDNPDFSVKTLADELAISPSLLYKKVKSISGKTTNEFVRYIRLRKAAQLLIDSDYNINQTAIHCGFNDVRYFREQFNKVFGMRPSDYIKKYRTSFSSKHRVIRNF